MKLPLQRFFVSIGMLSLGLISANAQITENFDNITLLAGNGWSLQNLSTPVGSTNWSQGPDLGGGGPFNSFNGATNAFISANYNNTGNTGTISNWLMAPNVTLRNGDVFTFYTRKVSPDSYADRLEVRMSTNGASTNAGVNATTVGDFTTLLLSINPSLVLGVYPTNWTQYTITISGLSAPTSGRLAFRYFVTGAGLSGTNSDFIGIDAFTYTPYVCPSLSMTPTSLPGGTAGTSYNQSLSQTGALGSPTYSVTAGALPPGVTLSASGNISGTPTATGTFNFNVTVNDNSGCTGTQAYSITMVCPLGGANLSTFPALCSNVTPYTLIEGAPAGGTYSGTGVSAGSFDPSVGSQTITYSLTDAYGCPQSTNAILTVNAAPTVSQTPFTAVCDNAGMVNLSGGSPAGGTYSGTGVSGSQFDPTSGTQNITYTYTDANGCSNIAAQMQTVNTAPTVTQSPLPDVCDNGGLVTLSGGSPAGGTYSGTGVSGGQFDPTGGPQLITYTYTDANGCSNSDSQTETVNIAPTVSLSSFTAVCSYDALVLLTEGSPVGGLYTGTGVTAGQFDPASGTQNITYTFTDANGCANSDAQVFTVNSQPTVSVVPSNATPCASYAPITLTGSPVGGTYFGSAALSGNAFDPAVAGVGPHQVSYTFTDGTTGCADTASTTITVGACAGIENIDLNSLVLVYPNPADEQISISFDANMANGNHIVEIYTMEGKMVFKKEILLNGTNHIETLNIATYSQGSYLMIITNMTGEKIVKKFIKK